MRTFTVTDIEAFVQAQNNKNYSQNNGWRNETLYKLTHRRRRNQIDIQLKYSLKS